MTRHFSKQTGEGVAFLASYGLSIIADQVFYVALSWYALGATESDAAAGAIVSMGALPRAVLLLPGGAVADRVGHRRVAIIAGFARAFVLGVAVLSLSCGTALTSSDVPSAATLSALAIAFGVVEAFCLPATQSMVIDVSDSDNLERTQGLFSAVQKAGVVLGPAIAGWMVKIFNPSRLFLSVCLVAVVSVAILAVGTSNREQLRRNCEVSEERVYSKTSLAAIFRDHTVMRCLVLILISEFAAAGVTGIGYTLLSSQRGWDADQMGLVLSMYGTGATVSALLVAVKPPKGTPSRIGLSVALCGVGFVLSGLPTALPAVCILAFVAGIGSGMSSTLLLTTYLAHVSDGPAATALSVMNLVAFGSTSVSYVAFGSVSSMVSPSGALAVFGGVLAASGLIFCKL